jgi:hypothetical protein
MRSSPSWPKIVGYQLEVVDTGVLHHLLGDESCGSSVLTDLLGKTAAIAGKPRTKGKIPKLRGRPDLIAEFQPGGTCLAVETKVDSMASPLQLKNQAVAPHCGVFFALGITGLGVSSPHPWGLQEWKVVLPHEWADILARHGAASDSVIGPYHRRGRAGSAGA